MFKFCNRCGQEKSEEEFYKGKKIPYCIPCTKNQYYERMYHFKKQCVDYKGGKCVDCGYDKCIACFDFHHLDSNEKDFNIGNKNGARTFTEEIRKELDKCVLLCSNCHRERHAKYVEINYDEFLEKKTKRQNSESFCRVIVSKTGSTYKIQNSYCSCGNLKTKRAKKCNDCYKAVRPSIPKKEFLEKIKDTTPITEIAKNHNVSDNTVRKWFKKYGLKTHNNKYWRNLSC
jgi:hypothetical protein